MRANTPIRRNRVISSRFGRLPSVEVGAGLEVWVSPRWSRTQGIPIADCHHLERHRIHSRSVPPTRQQHGPTNSSPRQSAISGWIRTAQHHDSAHFRCLGSADPAHATDLSNNTTAAYLARLDQLQAELVRRLQRYTDRRIVVHHPAWPYFARRISPPHCRHDSHATWNRTLCSSRA